MNHTGPLNIWMTTTGFRPLIGGAERMIETLAGGLAERGHVVTVITVRPDGDLPDVEEVGGYRVIRIGSQRGKAIAAASFLAGSVGRMLSERRRCQVIHAHQMFTPSVIGTITASVIRGSKLVITPHLGGADGDIQRLARKRTSPARLAAYRKVADGFVVISGEIREELLGLGVSEDRLFDIANGIDTERFRPVSEDERRAVADRLGLPAAGRNVVFAGRLVPIKGVDTLLAAVPLLDDDVNVIVAGEGELAGRVIEEAAGRLQGRLTFIGPRDDMADVLSACHGWVLPSRGEGLPLSLLEAMASGLAVVTTDVGGIGEVVADGVNGVMVPVDDPQGLASGIGKALRQRDQLAGEARRTVVDRYSAERMIDLHEQLYRNLLSPQVG